MADHGDAALAAALDELRDAPLDEFVATRDRLARALKVDGRADAAKALRARRRPSVVAWSINRVARERPDLVTSLFTAADEVRAAVEQGDGDALRVAMRAQRTRLDELTDATLERAATVSPNPRTHEDAIARTWAAAADDEGARDTVTSGALVGELRPGSAVHGTAATATGTTARTAGPGRATRSRLPRSGGSATTSASSTRPRDELALRRAEDAVTDARSALTDARRAAIAARKDAARAERAATRADDEEARARRRLTDAEATLAERRSR